jgi:Cdc6-like AAA superfamily ATPase
MSINRFQVWFDEPDSLPLLLYAPQGTGKTTLLTEFCDQLKEKYGNLVIYYEFRGGHLISEQNVNHCLITCMRKIFSNLSGDEDDDSLDAFTLFERFAKKFTEEEETLDSLEKRILFVVDCPERCEVSSCASLW